MLTPYQPTIRGYGRGTGRPWARIVAIVALAGALLGSLGSPLWGQCAPGDIIWISEDVNANVGTATGGGGTGTQCALRTVPGASYNSTVSPFGIQAGFDCACAGSTIRILAGAGNYGPGTPSRNNRLDATLEVQWTVTAAALFNGQISVEGWRSETVRCVEWGQANCPVVVDFSGGTQDGFRQVINNGTALSVSGLRITGAARDGLSLANYSESAMWFVEVDGAGRDAIGISSHAGFNFSNIYVHENALNGLSTGASATVILSEAWGNGQRGIYALSGLSVWEERNLTYANGGGGFGRSGSTREGPLWGTSADNDGSGWQGGTGSNFSGQLWSSLMVNNDRYAAESYSNPQTVANNFARMAMFGCTYGSGNGLGVLSSPNTEPRYVGIRGDLFLEPVVFADPAAGDYTPDCASQVLSRCAFVMPGGDTTFSFTPGVTPSCFGGGLVIQPVRSKR